MVIDGNSTEIARANARIQQLRADRGELGELAVAHPDPTLPYQLREGARVSFVASHPVAHEARVENGVSGEILAADPEVDAVMVGLDGSGREVPVVGEDLARLRLGYAHHVMRFQGATVTRAIGVTGGWQTSQQSTYVLGSRARERTDWYANRDDLGAEGTDVTRVERLADLQRRSAAQLPSIREPLANPEFDAFPELDLPPIAALEPELAP